jgi:hypothetical protein
MSADQRQVVFIATPARSDSVLGRRWNHARAVALVRLSAAEGLAGLSPLLTVACALEGFPEAAAGGDDSPAMDSSLSLLRSVKVTGGRLWVLGLDDGTLSAGCAIELGRWRHWSSVEGCTKQQIPSVLYWHVMGNRMVMSGLAEVWDALSGPPDPARLSLAEQILGLRTPGS